MRLSDRCTDKIGAGKHRRVWVHPDDPALVVKVAKTDLSREWIGPRSKGRPHRRERDFSNPGEWDIWRMVQGTELEEFFVPCLWMSEDGIELVQYRAEICKKIPKDGFHAWMRRDQSHHGFGFWNGRVRLVDYAQASILAAVREIQGIK